MLGLLSIHGSVDFTKKIDRNTQGKKSAGSGSQINQFSPLHFRRLAQIFDGSWDFLGTFVVSVFWLDIQ